MSLYDPLPSLACTRLVCLQPSIDFEDPVEVSHLTIELTASGPSRPYEAVSYTWGNEADLVPIRLNGRTVSIRRNLHRGLLRLRHQNAVRYLWIDAISISQSDLNEKAAQVQMIGQIFSSAAHVLIWLGEHADGSQELFRGWQSPEGMNRIFKTNSAREGKEIRRRMLIWTAFLSLPYWYRTWIVQEITLARHIVIHCGGDLVNWGDMMGARLQNEHADTENIFRCVVSYPMSGTDEPRLFQLATTFDNRVDHVQNIHRLWLDTPTIRKENILNVLQELRGFNCENKLDRIYALLSLEDATHLGYSEIKVDYTLSLPELVVDVLAKRYVFRSEKSWLHDDPEEDHPKYISWLIRALELTAKEHDELEGLVLAKLHHVQKDDIYILLHDNRWSRVYAGLSLVKEEANIVYGVSRIHDG